MKTLPRGGAPAILPYACDPADRGPSQMQAELPRHGAPPIIPAPARNHNTMAQYIFTMNRVGKVVPPKRYILRDISLSFFPGAKIGVLGLNGSGKSTLLRIMAGVDTEF